MSLARTIVVSLVAAALVLPAACRGSDSRARDGASLHSVGVAPSDSTLASWLAWQRDLMQLVNKQRDEQDAEVRRITAGSPRLGDDRIAHDPALLALLERQRADMAALQARMPEGPVVNALGATIGGLGQLTADADGRMVYLPRRDEAALAAARAQYGDAFVDWLLAHEREIDEALASDR